MRTTRRRISAVDPPVGHYAPRIRHWFAKRPRFRFHVHFTPTYGSWLNLVERWFAELTNTQLRRGVRQAAPLIARTTRSGH